MPLAILSRLYAAALVLVTAGVEAAPVYSVSAPIGTYGVSAPYAAKGAAGIATTTDNLHATPVGVTAGSEYFYVAPEGRILIKVNAPTFSFLWGSVDAENLVTYYTSAGAFSYSGVDLLNGFGIANRGDQSVSTVFSSTFTGGLIEAVAFTSGVVAFEFANALPSPQANGVPEPATLALSLAAFGALAWTRRRKS